MVYCSLVPRCAPSNICPLAPPPRHPPFPPTPTDAEECPRESGGPRVLCRRTAGARCRPRRPGTRLPQKRVAARHHAAAHRRQQRHASTATRTSACRRETGTTARQTTITHLTAHAQPAIAHPAPCADKSGSITPVRGGVASSTRADGKSEWGVSSAAAAGAADNSPSAAPAPPPEKRTGTKWRPEACSCVRRDTGITARRAAQPPSPPPRHRAATTARGCLAPRGGAQAAAMPLTRSAPPRRRHHHSVAAAATHPTDSAHQPAAQPSHTPRHALKHRAA